MLRNAGFHKLDSTNDPREAASLYVHTRPDLVLLDLHMPHMDGLEVMDRLNQIIEASYLPIVMLTGDLTPEARREALSRGAKDFVNKPFNPDEVLLRIRTLLETRFLYLQIQSQNQMLEAKVRDRTRELEAAQIEIIERLAKAAEFRDDTTGQHTERVGEMAALLARELGLSDAQVSLIRRAAPLHDVGKIGIPDSILLKLGKLTAAEFELVKTHTSIGARILSGSRFALLRLAEEIAFSHHERWDGSGYAGLAGNQIPLAGRIVAVADVFDALTQKRPYKPAWPVEEAIAEIERQRGLQFDPSIVDAFLRVVDSNSSPRDPPIGSADMQRATELSDWIREQVNASGARGIVVGLSGGVDSAVVLRLSQIAMEDQVVGVLMPCHSDAGDEVDAKMLADHFKVATIRVDLAPAYDRLVSDLKSAVGRLPEAIAQPSTAGSTDLRARIPLANIKPRLRMSVALLHRQLVELPGGRHRQSVGTAHWLLHEIRRRRGRHPAARQPAEERRADTGENARGAVSDHRQAAKRRSLAGSDG